MKAKILIVDDIEINRLILSDILQDNYEIEEASNGKEALELIERSNNKPSLILLDVKMPIMDGFETMALLHKDPNYSKIPVIFITAEKEDEVKGLESGAVDYIVKPFGPETVRLRVGTHIELAKYRENLELMVEEKAAELTNTKETFLETMADLIEYRSIESGQHVKRTKELSRILAERLREKGPYKSELQQIDFDALIKAVPLHDIGKIAIPDSILLKEGKLNDEEFEKIKTHTVEGSKIIDSLISSGIDDDYLWHCHDICMYHHEKWNGSGYPKGLSGKDIPLSARIVALVDVYDALVSERCYKDAFSHEKAVEIIRDSSGSHFDPVIADAFLDVADKFKDFEDVEKKS